MPELKNIVFIHGVADISKQWQRAKSFFESNGFILHFYNYRTLENELDIPLIVDGLAEFILRNIGPDKYQIFAHSQGGLIAEWFDRFRGDRNLKQIITIGTPFQGNTLPLLAPRSIVKRLPFGRKQFEGLACMSPVLSSLIRKRLETPQNRTPYITLISHSVKIFNIQSDGVVSVCAGNRDADYFLISKDNISPLTRPDSTRSVYVRTNHLPLAMVRSLQVNRIPNPFSTLLLSALSGETIALYDTFTPSQSAVAFPAEFKADLHFTDTTKKIVLHSTADKKYIIVYGNARSSEPLITIAGKTILLKPGKFTYLLSSAFLNTGT